MPLLNSLARNITLQRDYATEVHRYSYIYVKNIQLLTKSSNEKGCVILSANDIDLLELTIVFIVIEMQYVDIPEDKTIKIQHNYAY